MLSGARRLWPFVLMAWRRWQELPDHEKERYKRQAREYAQRGREYADRGREAIRRRPGGGSGESGR